MDYSKLLNRSVNIILEHKFLIILGIIAALGGGSTSSFQFSGNDFGSGRSFGEPGQFPQLDNEVSGLIIGIVIALICVAIVIGLAIWVVSTIARGGLIAGVDMIESGEKPTFSQAWSAGWQKIWTLLGIGLIPAIPGLILAVVGLLAVVAYGGLSGFFDGGEAVGLPLGGAEIGIVVLLLLCIVIPIALALTILRTFAERAAMIENLGVVDSYKRGWNVLRSNIGEAVILFVIQIAIGLVLAFALFVPGIIAALCCFLWPVMMVVQGAISAFISTLWTLAWNTWTNKQPPLVEKEPIMV